MAANTNLKFTLFGHVAVSDANRQSITTQRAGGTEKTTYYFFYNSVVQCRNGDTLPVTLRIYSPLGGVSFPDETMLYVLSRVCLSTTPAGDPPILDIMCHFPLPGDPPSDTNVGNSTYYDGLPVGLDFQCVDIIGVVTDACKPFDEDDNTVDTSLAHPTAKACVVEVSEYIASRRLGTTIQ